MPEQEKSSQQAIRHVLSRDFVLGFLAVFAFMAAFFALVPVLPIYLAKLGSSVADIGVLVGAYSISALVFRLLVGKALLKYSEKTIMISGTVIFALTFLACIVVRPFWPFFAVRFFQGIAFASFDTAIFTFIVKVVPTVYRGRGIAYFMQAPMLAMALAPSFGVLLYNRHNFIALFLCCMVLSLCALFFSWGVKGKEIKESDPAPPVRKNFFLDLKIIPSAITSLLHMFVFGSLVAFIPLYAVQCGVSNPGHFFSAMAVMLVMGRALGGGILDTYSKEKIISIVICCSMTAMVILSFSKTLAMFIFVGLFWGTGGAFFFPASMAHALEHAGSSDGTAIGTFRALTDLGLALGPTTMGVIISLTNYRTMFLCLAFICLINFVYFHFYVRKRR